VLTVEAKDEQDARAKAFAERQEDGVVWKYVEEDEEYDARIVDVDQV
jgi:hypothetical protein